MAHVWTDIAHALVGWTITGPTTTDFPGFYVARAWAVGRELRWPFLVDDAGVVHAYVGCCCATLDEARRCVSPWLTNIGREPGDDPVIVESWF
jgi:hypothetical protein